MHSLRACRKACAAVLAVALLAAFSPAGSTEIDPLLQRLADTHAVRGVGPAIAEAEGYSVQPRMTAQGVLFPLILETADPDAAARENASTFATAGARVDAKSRSLMRVLAPLSAVSRFSALRGVAKVRLPYPLMEADGYGSRVSESVALTGGEDHHLLGNAGAGARVAVIDLGFMQLQAAKTAGEIPGNVITFDFTGLGLEAGTQHGTGVAEHVLDMAPGAQLYLLKVGDEVDLQNAAAYLRNNNIRIANLSVAWVSASYYDDTGIINTVINDSRDVDGVFWSVAAGNFAQMHWRGTWADSNGNGRLEFSGTDEALALQGTASTISVHLNWNQYGVSNKTNLDLYLLSSTGAVVAQSIVNNRFTDPVETISYTYNAAEAPYSLQVRVASGSAAGLNVSLFSYNHNLEYKVAASSVADPASAHGAFTVAAIHKNNWTQVNPATEAYSSQGPTTDGRLKPNAAAPDCTSSLTYGANSCGTSFAAPTMAGAAALVLAANPGYTAADIANALAATTVPPTNPVASDAIGPYDYRIGYGRVSLDADNDGSNHNSDNCPLAANADQADYDGDGLGNVCDADADGDGLDAAAELSAGSNPLNADTDGDGLNDYDEVIVHGTSAVLADTDGDGVSDYDEVIVYGTDPLSPPMLQGDIAPAGAPDGVINIIDLLRLTRFVGGLETPTAQESSRADMNADSVLDVRDTLALGRALGY